MNEFVDEHAIVEHFVCETINGMSNRFKQKAPPTCQSRLYNDEKPSVCECARFFYVYVVN